MRVMVSGELCLASAILGTEHESKEKLGLVVTGEWHKHRRVSGCWQAREGES